MPKVKQRPFSDRKGALKNSRLRVIFRPYRLFSRPSPLQADLSCLQLALDACKGGLWEWAPETKTARYSPRFLEILGERPAELSSKDKELFEPWLHPEDRASLMQLMRLRSGEGLAFETECRFQHKDGHYLWCLLRGQSRQDKAGAVTRTVGLLTDINRRKRSEAMKNEFISTLSHEIRTPLTAIRGSLGLATMGVTGELPPKAKELVEIAHKHSEHLILLINDILDIEKIERKEIRFEVKEEPLNPLIERALDAMRASLGPHSRVRFHFNPLLLDATVRVDGYRFLQALCHLLSHAMKFSPEDATIRVQAKRNDGQLRISVEGPGEGIAEALREQMLSRYSAASPKQTKYHAGIGLGIAKALIEQMQGAIGFAIEPGCGSAVHIELPEVERPSTMSLEPLIKERQRILVVEDDVHLAKLICVTLEQAGFETSVAHTAKEARLLLSTVAFTAMTLDLMLPDQNGLSLLRDIRADEATATMPVIVLSFRAEEGRLMVEGEAVGITEWLGKPFDMHRLLDSIRYFAWLDNTRRPRVLHIEDDEDLLHLIALMIKDMADVVPARTLKQAEECLKKEMFDLILLDNCLPDGSGLDLLPKLAEHQASVPIVILSGNETGQDVSDQVAAALVKARHSESEIVETLRRLLSPYGAQETLAEEPSYLKASAH